MEAILDTLGQSIGLWGYVVLFFYSLGGGLVALMAAGILSSGVIESFGTLNIYISIFIAFLGNLIGSSGLFYISRYQKREVMGYFKAHRRKIALGHIWIKKYDFWIIFIHKYLYMIKTIVPLVIGFSKYSARKFLAYNVLSTALWAVSIGTASFLAGESLKRLYEKYQNPYIFQIIVIAFIILIIAAISINAKKNKQK